MTTGTQTHATGNERDTTVTDTETKMDDYTATGLAEGFIDADSEDQVIEAWQYLHDTGLAYRLQGWFGRTARFLVEKGYINA